MTLFIPALLTILQTGFAAELRVAPSGAPYTTIQDAVDAAAEYDSILVAAGTYLQQTNHAAPAGYTGPATIRQNVFIDKTVSIYGGYNTSFTERNPGVYMTVIEAAGTGRGLFIGPNGLPVIDGLVVRGGDASGYGGTAWGDAGGGIFCDRSSAVIINCVIESCSADGGGGVFFSYCDNFNLLHCDLAGNTATTSGGGAYVHSSGGFVEDCDFTSNHADTMAGGVYIAYEFPWIDGNRFDTNSATDAGGGIVLYYTGARVAGNRLTNNGADNGAGISSYSSTGDLSGNQITGNTGVNHGAGIYLEDCTHRLINNFVCRNWLMGTSGTGSGIYCDGGNLSFLHNTMDINYGGDTSAVFLSSLTASPGTAYFVNQITADHARGIYADTGWNVTMESMLWSANTSDWIGPGSFSVGAGMLHGDPKFVNSMGDDYHIQSGSAAIDTGIDASVADDIDGHFRPWNGGFDIGADEFRSIPALGVWMDLPQQVHPGESFFVNGYLENSGALLTGVQVFFILDVYGELWFWPSWSYFDASTSTGVDFQTRDVSPGESRIYVLNPFLWPDTGSASATGLRFWGAMVDPVTGTLIGDYGMVEWGYSP